MNFKLKALHAALAMGLALGLSDAALAATMLDVNQAKVVSLPKDAATVFVSEPKVATYQVLSPKKVILFGRGAGTTSFMALDGQGNPIFTTDVVVSQSTAQMSAALQREFPSLNLKLTPAADGVIVSGQVPSAQVAADVVALLDAFVKSSTGSSAPQGSSTSGSDGDDPASQLPEVPDDALSGPGNGKGTLGAHAGKVINRLTVTMPNQVVIRVRIAEVNRGVAQQLGVNWFWSKTTGGHNSIAIGLANNAVTSSTPGVTTALAAVTDAASTVIPDFSAMIDALADENLVSVLAEPNLSVVSGETASFLAGGEIPYPQISTSNSNATGFEFKEYGVMLDVTPTVLSENRISLRVRPEVSEPNSAESITMNGVQVPAFTTRRADTTIELADGQSFVIGGLLQNKLVNEVSKIPGLGDLPVLGALFRNSSFQRGESELVIIATAYIGQPQGNNLRIPNANVVIPGVFNRLFLDQQPTVSSGEIRPQDLNYY